MHPEIDPLGRQVCHRATARLHTGPELEVLTAHERLVIAAKLVPNDRLAKHDGGVEERSVEQQLPLDRERRRRLRPCSYGNSFTARIDVARLSPEDHDMRVLLEVLELRRKTADVRDVVGVVTRYEGSARMAQAEVQRSRQPDV